MDGNDIKALVTLFVMALLFAIIGYSLLFKPSKVRNICFKMMGFFYSNGLSFFYKKRKAMMSGNWFLYYLRLVGIIVSLIFFLFLYLIVFKLRGN